MDASSDDNADSRTSGVGRKRVLQEDPAYGDSLVIDSEEDSSRHKRIKAVHKDDDEEPSFMEVGDDASSQQSVAIDGSAIQVPPPASGDDLTGPPPSTWNKGVQSALRTSFGKKKGSRLRDMSLSTPLEQGSHQNEKSAATMDDNSSISVLQTPSTEHSEPSQDKSGIAFPADVGEIMDGSKSQSVGNEAPQRRDGSSAVGASKSPSQGSKPLYYNEAMSALRKEAETRGFVFSPARFKKDGKRIGKVMELNPTVVDQAIRDVMDNAAVKLRKKLAQKDKKTLKTSTSSANIEEAGAEQIAALQMELAPNNSKSFYGYHTGSGASAIYANKLGTFILREIFSDTKKRAAEASDLTFTVFAVLFFADNLKALVPIIHKVTHKMMTGAFSTYVTNFIDVVDHDVLHADVRKPASSSLARLFIKSVRENIQSSEGQAASSRESMVWSGLVQLATRALGLPETQPANVNSTQLIGLDRKSDGVASEATYNSSRTDAVAEMQEAAAAAIHVPNEIEVRLQEKYFPASYGDGFLHLCLACAGDGHATATCPAMQCRTCQTSGHSTLCCAQNVRCGKCRQTGHEKARCPEKLKPSATETVACDLCQSTDHIEIACPLIWRSFTVKEDNARKIHELPIHCFCCGGSNHYGPECGLHKGPVLSGDRTWSMKNWKRYIDWNSKERALSAGVDYSVPAKSTAKGRKDFSIKGRSTDPIEIDDSDEDSSSFIRPLINKKTQERVHNQSTSLRTGNNHKPEGTFSSYPPHHKQNVAHNLESSLATTVVSNEGRSTGGFDQNQPGPGGFVPISMPRSAGNSRGGKGGRGGTIGKDGRGRGPKGSTRAEKRKQASGSKAGNGNGEQKKRPRASKAKRDKTNAGK